MATEVKLLGIWPSPFVFRVKVALQLKGVDYEYFEEDPFNKSPRLLESNPIHKKVPVLIHGEKPINESLTILEYIEETWQNNPLLPQDPYERATVRFWAKFVDDLFWNKAFAAFIAKGEAKEKIEKEVIEGLEKIDGAIKEKSSLFNSAAGGESIGFLDIVFGVIGYWLPIYEEAGSMQTHTQKFPAIAEWTTKFVNHPVIKENLPSTESLLPFFRQVREFVSSASNN
ncbi:hypothetical protein WN944_026008 [Citrus x changshan-huyou]|uniref:Glutathione S-transferase n=1 Tax=Citrus x changshan-huyou TaxID=2935761 RepID=A0AAP0LVJ5_9ROSI